MNYELAKQLKEVGFPQKGDGIVLHQGPMVAGTKTEWVDEQTAYSPTLEELIEACEDGEHALSVEWSAVTKSWQARMWYPPIKCSHHFSCSCGGTGKYVMAEWYDSPTEAVAHLWLALQTKPTIK